MKPSQEENYLPPGQETKRKLRILVAPLDWGLGHATRCIPVIYELLRQQSEVWLAGEGAQKALLAREFPQLPFLDLPGYRVQYGRSAGSMIWRMLGQSAKLLRAIKRENEWLQKTAEEHSLDAVISDNRFGLSHPHIASVIITHQLLIKSPLGKWSENLIQQKNYRFINRFRECWIPDVSNDGLAGELSHPPKKPGVPLRYIGPLSRFKQEDNAPVIKGRLLCILSGPEPQRTILENKIIHEIAHYQGSAVVVRGLPAGAKLIPSTNSIRFYNHLSAAELEKEIAAAEFVISRSGYSTVMDLIKLQKKSILIPTPGQTEQEYLGKYLSEKKHILCMAQKDFSLHKALEQAVGYPYHLPGEIPGDLENTVRTFLASIR